MHVCKWILPLLVLLLLSADASSQVTIRGTVKDSKGNPLQGASISLKDSYDGTTSDSAGRFSFRTTEKGDRLLIVSNIGYVPLEISLRLEQGLLEKEIVLKQEITELSAVVLSAGSFEASDRKRAAAVLDPIDIVTTASANGDVTEALKTLPGAQQVGEKEGLFVRGGTATETKTFIDGTLVNNFFYSSVPNVAQFSRFSPFLFKGTVFSTGGYSALYGQALSSALILESIDLPDRSSANLSITVLSAGGGFQKLAKKKNASWGINYGYTNLGLAFAVIPQRQDFSKVPSYHNIDANFRIKTSGTGILKYYGYYSSNRLAFTVPSIDTSGYLDGFSIRNNSHYHNLSWKEKIGRTWKIYLGFSFSQNEDDVHSSLQNMSKSEVLLQDLQFKNFRVNSKGTFVNAKAVLEKKLRGLSAIRMGSEYNYSTDDVRYKDYNQQLYPSGFSSRIFSLFTEGDLYATNELAMKAGLRMEHSSLPGRANLAPRFSLAYKLGKGSQASIAYGIFYQDPERKYLPSPNPLGYMRAAHYILQYQRVLNQQSLRAEFFYKKYKDLLKTGTQGYPEAALNNNGYGMAKGFELFWRDRKTIPDFDYWVSYSFLDTKRDFLNFPFAITPNFAAAHTASLVTKKFIQKLKSNFNTAFNYASGRPYYHIMPDSAGFRFTDRGKGIPYYNFSVSVNYLPFIGKQNPKAYTVLVLQVSNVFNIRQEYGYQYSYNGQRKEVIVPSSRMFVFLGAFISFGTDRSDEILNNGLSRIF